MTARIGITTYRERAAWGVWDQPADLLPATYANAVHESGAAALLLPPGPAQLAGAVLDGLDGLVLAGGADVDPARYHESRDERSDVPRTDRDEWEFTLAGLALRRGLPVLGVCRGLQVLNVLLGGTLVQHLPDRHGSVPHAGTPGEFVDHEVRIDTSSRIGAILGERASAASHHHQGIDRLADDLVATAWTDDGVIEAVERPGDAWVAAVQWHPEVHDGERLFAAFADICRATNAVPLP